MVIYKFEKKKHKTHIYNNNIELIIVHYIFSS